MEERGTPVLSENEVFQVKTRRENNVRIKKQELKNNRMVCSNRPRVAACWSGTLFMYQRNSSWSRNTFMKKRKTNIITDDPSRSDSEGR